jgi:DNA-binding NarL/FixJ family response regulator
MVESPVSNHQTDVGGGRSDSVTVVLTDHDRELSSDLRAALEIAGFTVVAEASTAEHAVRAVLMHRPQICLLEADVPGSTITAIREILTELPETRIGMLAESTTNKAALRAIHAGADGVLPTAAPSEKLTAGVRALARGELPLPRALTARVVEEWRMPSTIPPFEPPSRIAATLLYVPRFMHHLRRRLRSQMGVKAAWASTRARMQLYRSRR